METEDLESILSRRYESNEIWIVSGQVDGEAMDFNNDSLCVLHLLYLRLPFSGSEILIES